MKESLMDVFEQHVIYFLTGFVAVISISLITFFLYAFIIAPVLFLGWYYTLVVPAIGTAMYFIGKHIITKVK